MTTRRRVLLAGGIGLLVAPRLSRGQPKSKTPRIGVVWVYYMSDPDVMKVRSAFLERLSALGYVEGKNIVIEERSSEGHPERRAELARELVASKVDIIVTPSVATSTAARQATSTIPIVMVHAGDPVGAGLIASLARPGGNVTGTTNLLLGGKQVELIRELVPRAVKLAMLVNPSNAGTRTYVADATETCHRLNCGITIAEVTRDDRRMINAVREQAVQYVIDNRAAANLQQRLGYAVRERIESAAAVTGSENECVHG